MQKIILRHRFCQKKHVYLQPILRQVLKLASTKKITLT